MSKVTAFIPEAGDIRLRSMCLIMEDAALSTIDLNIKITVFDVKSAHAPINSNQPSQVSRAIRLLTHLCQMNFPILINWTSPI